MVRRTGFASLPLHGGKAPAWLFGRMVRFSREIVIYLVSEFGAAEVLRRLSDPFWFQAFGCVLGFDWHSSGVTTTVCGAVKESLKDIDADLGLFAAGGKGATSRKAPHEIVAACDRLGRDAAPLVYASKIAAKVDSAAVQDGYQLYHRVFFFTTSGEWSVIQQGMSDANRTARRYHWLSEHVESFVDEPHATGFRAAAWDRGRWAEDAAGAGARLGIAARRGREHARSSPLCVRARRQEGFRFRSTGRLTIARSKSCTTRSTDRPSIGPRKSVHSNAWLPLSRRRPASHYCQNLARDVARTSFFAGNGGFGSD